MKIALYKHDDPDANPPADVMRPEPDMKAEVDDANFAGAARDAAWAFANYSGSAYVTAVEPTGARIVTVGCFFHDE